MTLLGLSFPSLFVGCTFCTEQSYNYVIYMQSMHGNFSSFWGQRSKRFTYSGGGFAWSEVGWLCGALTLDAGGMRGWKGLRLPLSRQIQCVRTAALCSSPRLLHSSSGSQDESSHSRAHFHFLHICTRWLRFFLPPCKIHTKFMYTTLYKIFQLKLWKLTAMLFFFITTLRLYWFFVKFIMLM